MRPAWLAASEGALQRAAAAPAQPRRGSVAEVEAASLWFNMMPQVRRIAWLGAAADLGVLGTPLVLYRLALGGFTP